MQKEDDEPRPSHLPTALTITKPSWNDENDEMPIPEEEENVQILYFHILNIDWWRRRWRKYRIWQSYQANDWEKKYHQSKHIFIFSDFDQIPNFL